MNRILLLGADGQIGWELQRSLAPLGQVIALGHHGLARGATEVVAGPLCGNLARLADLESTIACLRPNVVVNAAGYTSVDQAEREPGVAHQVNAMAPGRIAHAVHAVSGWLVHFSTDYVFSGEGERPWREEDSPAPLNVYGRTKLRGEEAIRESGCRHLILRTSWVHAPRGRNFPRIVLRRAQSEPTLFVVDDQVGAPTGADLVADVSAHMIRIVERQPELGGLYHVTARGTTSRYECARFLIACARANGWRGLLPEILPVPSPASKAEARRPKNCRLDCAKLERVSGLRMPEWQDGIRRLLAELSEVRDRSRNVAEKDATCGRAS